MSIPEFELESEQKLTEALEAMILHQFNQTVDLGVSLNADYSGLENLQNNERRFAELLLSREKLLVFPEPKILTIDHIPDFYVLNIDHGLLRVGKFIELTVSSDAQIKAGDSIVSRKVRQRECFVETGLPFVFLCKEQQLKIREGCCPNLF